jgi:hypothetical protein
MVYPSPRASCSDPAGRQNGTRCPSCRRRLNTGPPAPVEYWSILARGRWCPAGPVIWLDPCGRDQGKALLGVELWAEIRRLKQRGGSVAARDPSPHGRSSRHDPQRVGVVDAAVVAPAEGRRALLPDDSSDQSGAPRPASREQGAEMCGAASIAVRPPEPRIRFTNSWPSTPRSGRTCIAVPSPAPGAGSSDPTMSTWPRPTSWSP